MPATLLTLKLSCFLLVSPTRFSLQPCKVAVDLLHQVFNTLNIYGRHHVNLEILVFSYKLTKEVLLRNETGLFF